MTFFEIWLEGVAYIALFVVIICSICGIAENFGEIICGIKVICHRMGEWLFDAVTAYYKFKLNRKRRKDAK